VTRTQGLLANVSLVVASLVVCLGLAEAAIAFIDWLHPKWILDTNGTSTTGAHLDDVPLAYGISRDLFFVDPAPLPNRTKPPQDWIDLDHQLQKASQSSTAADGFKQWDMWKAWNAAFVGYPCQNRHLRGAPGRLFVYDPPDGHPRPPFRYLPKTTTPMGLTTNDFGWGDDPLHFAVQRTRYVLSSSEHRPQRSRKAIRTPVRSISKHG
jgi:hypothetical protein